MGSKFTLYDAIVVILLFQVVIIATTCSIVPQRRKKDDASVQLALKREEDSTDNAFKNFDIALGVLEELLSLIRTGEDDSLRHSRALLAHFYEMIRGTSDGPIIHSNYHTLFDYIQKTPELWELLNKGLKDFQVMLELENEYGDKFNQFIKISYLLQDKIKKGDEDIEKIRLETQNLLDGWERVQVPYFQSCKTLNGQELNLINKLVKSLSELKEKVRRGLPFANDTEHLLWNYLVHYQASLPNLVHAINNGGCHQTTLSPEITLEYW